MKGIKYPEDRRADYDKYLLGKMEGECMKDSRGNEICKGTRLKSTSRFVKREIVCISMHKGFARFKAMNQFREKALPFPMKNAEMEKSCWVVADKLEEVGA